MNREELLDSVDRQIITAPPFALGGYTMFLQALRAVVELHKASKVEGRWGKVQLCCLRCQTNYPCSTIQAIEKELG